MKMTALEKAVIFLRRLKGHTRNNSPRARRSRATYYIAYCQMRQMFVTVYLSHMHSKLRLMHIYDMTCALSLNEHLALSI